MRTALSLLLLLTLLPAAVQGQKKKKKKPEVEITQTLEVIPDPPASVTVETAKLEFLASPLSGKGLLSQQIRDALKALRSQAGSRQIVKIRAFVAGTGDQRRVQSIVAETFAERNNPCRPSPPSRSACCPWKARRSSSKPSSAARKW